MLLVLFVVLCRPVAGPVKAVVLVLFSLCVVFCLLVAGLVKAVVLVLFVLCVVLCLPVAGPCKGGCSGAACSFSGLVSTRCGAL